MATGGLLILTQKCKETLKTLFGALRTRCPKSGDARGPGSVGGPGSWLVFPRPNRPQFEKTSSGDPLSSRDPLPLPKVLEVRGGCPGRNGGSRLEGGGGPGPWCSSACTGSRSVGIPRAGSPQRAGTPRIFPQKHSKSTPWGTFLPGSLGTPGGRDRNSHAHVGIIIHM